MLADDTLHCNGRSRLTSVDAPKLSLATGEQFGFAMTKYFPQPMCGGVAVIDYDSDDKMAPFLRELVRTAPIVTQLL